MPIIALTREVSPAIGRCELTHLERTAIDPELAAAQHEAYEACLTAAGCTVQRLDASSHMPDSVFIEDTAVVFDEIAVIARPGASSRRAETIAVEEALVRYRAVQCVEPPGTLDGGDVLRVGRTVFVGRSTRTNSVASEQLRSILSPLGYKLRVVDVRGCLHLKSAVTSVAENALLVNPEWVSESDFAGFDLVEVHPAEPFGANALRVGDRVIYALAFPRTRERLERRGIRVDTIDVSELAKAEGGVTCCSILVPTGQPLLHPASALIISA
jgi:dimethylargininase